MQLRIRNLAAFAAGLLGSRMPGQGEILPWHRRGIKTSPRWQAEKDAERARRAEWAIAAAAGKRWAKGQHRKPHWAGAFA